MSRSSLVILAGISFIGCSRSGAAAGPTPPPVASEAATPATPSASASAAGKGDHAADCRLVVRELEIGPPNGRGVNVANILPESEPQRDANLAAIDGYVAKWAEIEPRVGTPAVRDAASAYVVALKKQRRVIAALRYEMPSPAAPPPPPAKPPKKMTKSELAREAALREAMEFGMEGLLSSRGPGQFLREEDREAFNDARVHYLDAWEPLLRMCEERE